MTGSDGDGRMQCSICESEFDPCLSVAVPFCSTRCQQVDLGRWFNEEHSLPVEPDEGSEASLENGTDQHEWGNGQFPPSLP